ncbi:MAG: LuxR C-terminal-related transcriptional regulator [Oscillospiraceae bacterium]|jgi:LuxR family maltose regulon positive regulatory protein|nr:LuxR C-terminal-related transcriptional regulator [Oscillospiraceae bacterium]
MKTIIKIPRAILIKQLDSLLDRRVLYIHAAAGFGKTVSSLIWLEHREKTASTKYSWISLDEHDNIMAEFCKRFVSALMYLQSDNTALNELAAHRGFGAAPVEFALHALSSLDDTRSPCILVLDDLHTIVNTDILKLLPTLFNRLPENFTVLLLSRTMPPDSFSDMVVKGNLVIVDAENLQFTGEEIKSFFNKNGRQISSSQANEILSSTGGWAIGIRAMLLSDEGSFNADLVGSFFDSFLKNHVWERWDERLKNFMMSLSVADELSPELCLWLITDKRQSVNISGSEILAEMVRENAFLRESENGTYRFHDLFRKFLINMLKKNGKQAVSVQQNKAGDYYFNKKDYFRAVEYYLKGNNDEGIANSLYQMYDYNSNSASIEDTLYTIHMAVNDAIVEKHSFLLEVQIWASYVEGRADDFEMYLDRYYKLFSEIVIQNPRSAIIRMLLQCIDYRKDLLRYLKTLRMIPFKGSVKAFAPSITNNMPLMHRSILDFSAFSIDTDKNMLLLEKSIGAVVGVEYTVMKECLYAGFYYEKGSLNHACEHALAACSNISGVCSPEVKFCAMMILASALLADSKESEANKILNNVENIIENDKAFYLKPNLRAYLFRLKLSNGDRSAAEEWLQKYNGNMIDFLSLYKSYQHFTTVRAHIVIGDYNHAILALKKLLKLCERFMRTLDIIEARILLAIVYWKKGKSGQSTALEYLEQAAATAQEYGYTQVFANEGAELVNMLYKLQRRTIQKENKCSVSGAFVKTLYIDAVSNSKHKGRLTGNQTHKNLTFTEKQNTVIRLMCQGHTRNEIAEKMGLKPYGVKSHMELIYRKLDVANNVDAVLKIKELGILE